ncbi:MAG TPA: F0F1 ATP synthase subunit B [Armatimonadota bacterium]|nr:F0F1 ATP synthase subunit B [Armatimonadota bacterium]
METLFEELGIDPTIIVVNIIGFILLVWLLKRFLYRPITQMMDQRAEDIRSTYAAAETEKAAMEELRRDYEEQLADIEAEAHERIQAAIKEAHSIRDDIIADAREKSDAIILRGEEELAREREKAIVELREEVANLIISASSKLLERSLDDQSHRRLIDEFISGVGEKK